MYNDLEAAELSKPLPPAPIEAEQSVEVNKMDLPLSPTNTDEQVDFLATKTALESEGVVGNLVDKKSAELNAKAEAKVSTAEAQLAEAETKRIAAHSNKAEAFFNANKQVLGIIGIREPLGYNTMCWLFAPAIVLFILIAIIVFFPVSIVKYIINFFIDISGDIATKVAKNGVKIFLAILSSVFAAGLLGAIYWLITGVILK